MMLGLTRFLGLRPSVAPFGPKGRSWMTARGDRDDGVPPGAGSLSRSLAATAVLALVVSACGGGDDDSSSATTTDDAVQETSGETDATDVPDVADAPETTAAPVTVAPASTVVSTAAPADTAPADTSDPASPSDERWVSPDGDYSIAFPAEPSPLELPLPEVAGVGDEATFTLYLAESDAVGFISSRIDYADYGLGEAGLDLLGARDGAVTNVGGELLSSDDIVLQGRDGVRFSFSVTNPGTGAGEGVIFLDGTLLHQAVAVGEVGQETELAGFVDSFMFTEDRT